MRLSLKYVILTYFFARCVSWLYSASQILRLEIVCGIIEAKKCGKISLKIKNNEAVFE